MSELIPEHIFPAMILSEDLGSPELNDLNKRFTAGTLKHSQYLEGLAQVVRKQERSLRTSQEKQKRKQSKRTSLLVVINESDAPLEVSDEIRAESQIEQTPTLESSQSIEEIPALVEPSQPIEETPSVIEPIENTSNPLESYVEIPSADDNDTPPSTPERITDATDASVIAVELPSPINAEMGYNMGYDINYAPPMIISEINPPQEDQDLEDCKICWTNGASINLSCGHAYCQACLNELVRVACLNSAGNGIAVNCPDCGLKVTPDVLRTFLESEALRVFEYFEMKITADNLPQKPAACSSDGCVGLLIPDWLTSANKYQCKFCHVQHCADCFSADHPGMTCAAARRLNRPRSRTSRFFRQVRITAKAIPTYLATQLTMTLHPNAKRCPNCFNWIIKRGGCHHMSCGHCHVSFCWDCRSNYHRGFHCIFNALLFPVALPVAAAICTAYVGIGILPWSALALGSFLKHKIRRSLGLSQGNWSPSKGFADSAMMVFYIGQYVAPFPYFQMFH